MTFDFEALVDSATAPYAEVSRYAYEFSRGKLRHDPVFRALFKHGLIPDNGVLLDLGCGLGVLPALLHEACNSYRAGKWPDEWSPPPQNLKLHGIELRSRKAAIAKQVLEGKAIIRQGDIRTAEFPDCDVVVILDVLLYLGGAEQLQVLQRVAQSLRPGGMLILREGDANGGIRFQVTRFSEQMCCLLRGEGWRDLQYRSASEWIGLLRGFGFSVEALPMSEGTPFSNVLFRATRLDVN